MRVATWNVLHRVHAENWGELPRLRTTQEESRNAAIALRCWAGGWDVMCLQEVSADQLAALEASAPAGAQVLSFVYPRVPRRRVPNPAQTTVSTEHLAVLVAGGGARRVAASAFPGDPGKGFLAVSLMNGVVVVDTHVTWGALASGQLAQVADHARKTSGPGLILGDFNASAAEVALGLGADFAFGAAPDGSLPTRPRFDGRDKSMDIDHVVARRGRVNDLRVLPHEGLSDHNLVEARVSFD